ncbi:MAG TPA: FAD-dependent oxidoreductase [Candidatus Saccharimonadia bacterium]|nr:FAD-dependent oxidoreductase [Candidatus Saccharimonadia bacterium]
MILQHIARRHVTDNVWSYDFEPETRLKWIAGQFIRVGLPHPNPDAGGTKRFFTISSAPHEQVITITTRLTGSSFKRALDNLKPHDNIQLLDTPAGDFTWPQTTLGIVFVAQGIGITPFYSMMKDRLYRSLPVQATIIYAGRTDRHALFAGQLHKWSHEHPELVVHRTASPVTPRMLTQHIIPANSFIMASGPSSLIALLSPPYNMPGRQLKTDFFPGYITEDY